MTLGVLLQEFADRSGVAVPPLEASAGTPVSSIAYDSRQARAGSVFVALRGVNADGTGFAREAIARGAIAVVVGVGGAGRRLGAVGAGARRAARARGAVARSSMTIRASS